jgi:hypothetical protein
LREAIGVEEDGGVLDPAQSRREVRLLEEYLRGSPILGRLPKGENDGGEREEDDGDEHDPFPPEKKTYIVPNSRLWICRIWQGCSPLDPKLAVGETLLQNEMIVKPLKTI